MLDAISVILHDVMVGLIASAIYDQVVRKDRD